MGHTVRQTTAETPLRVCAHASTIGYRLQTLTSYRHDAARSAMSTISFVFSIISCLNITEKRKVGYTVRYVAMFYVREAEAHGKRRGSARCGGMTPYHNTCIYAISCSPIKLSPHALSYAYARRRLEHADCTILLYLKSRRRRRPDKSGSDTVTVTETVATRDLVHEGRDSLSGRGVVLSSYIRAPHRPREGGPRHEHDLARAGSSGGARVSAATSAGWRMVPRVAIW